MNLVGTTMAYLGRLEPKAAFDKLAMVVSHNLSAVRRQIENAASRPELERLHRMSSDLLPGYTHPTCRSFYADPDIRRMIEASLATTGEIARRHNVRLSMHPSQFCVIASVNEAAVTNGVAEFEYHAEIMGHLGFGEGWHRAAPTSTSMGVRAPWERRASSRAWRACPRPARNLITVENDEVSYGLDDLLPLVDSLPVVLDLHHHWIASRGEYIEPEDARIARIKESWRGVRPLSHVSVSREDLLAGHDIEVRPDFIGLGHRRHQAQGSPRPFRPNVERGRQRPRRPSHDLVGFRGGSQAEEHRIRGLARHVEHWREARHVAA